MSAKPLHMNTAILGLGNTILTDDGAGIYAAREIRRLLGERPRLSILEASVGGFGFIDLLSGFERAAILDAIHTAGGKPGEFYELDRGALKPSARLSSLHQIDFATACELARRMGSPFPAEIAIFVMEVADEFSFGERPTPEVAAAIPRMAEEVVRALRERGWWPSDEGRG